MFMQYFRSILEKKQGWCYFLEILDGRHEDTPHKLMMTKGHINLR